MSTAATRPQSRPAPAVVVEASFDDDDDVDPLDALDESLEPELVVEESVLVDSLPVVVESFFPLEPDFFRLSVL
jgi:hypothetical protein